MSSLFRGAFLFAWLAVAVLSLLPVDRLPSGVFDWWDKAQHGLGSLVLALLRLWGYSAFPGHVVLGLLGLVPPLSSPKRQQAGAVVTGRTGWPVL